jgi:hypothetical protein
MVPLVRQITLAEERRHQLSLVARERGTAPYMEFSFFSNRGY